MHLFTYLKLYTAYTCRCFCGAAEAPCDFTSGFHPWLCFDISNSKPSKVEGRTSGILKIFGFIVVSMGIAILALGSALWVTWMGSLGPPKKKTGVRCVMEMFNFSRLEEIKLLWGSLGLVDFYRVPVEILTLLISTGRLKMYQTLLYAASGNLRYVARGKGQTSLWCQ